MNLEFDQSISEHLIAVYTTPDVVNQRQQIVDSMLIDPGQNILDVGSGPGFLAHSIGQKVGPSGQVCGVDVSEPLLDFARHYCAQYPWIGFRSADATRIPFPDHSFDATVITQVLEYVSDVESVLAEIFRVLRPGGRVFIVDTDWDSIVWHSSNRARMSRILTAWDEHLSDPFLPRTLASKLLKTGFSIEMRQLIPLFNPTYDERTYSNKMIDIIAPFVAGRCGVTAEEAQDWANDLRYLGRQGNYFFSLNRYMFGARKPFLSI